MNRFGIGEFVKIKGKKGNFKVMETLTRNDLKKPTRIYRLKGSQKWYKVSMLEKSDYKEYTEKESKEYRGWNVNKKTRIR